MSFIQTHRGLNRTKDEVRENLLSLHVLELGQMSSPAFGLDLTSSALLILRFLELDWNYITDSTVFYDTFHIYECISVFSENPD